jgi:hypothetical protein
MCDATCVPLFSHCHYRNHALLLSRVQSGLTVFVYMTWVTEYAPIIAVGFRHLANSDSAPSDGSLNLPFLV